VIHYIRDRHHTVLKEITLKLVMLLALVTGQRAQTLHLLKLSNMTRENNSIIFQFTDPLKTTEPGTTSLILHSFPDEIRLCPVTLLNYYIDRTADYRDIPSGAEPIDQLLLSHIRPHGAVSRDTIRRWILLTMGNAGIDTSIFKAHSTRAASTSKALKKEVPLQSILNAAMWKSDSTFAKFYNKPVKVQDRQFADSILKV
jgi:integrase